MKLPSKSSALHARAALIIPWIVNGSLPAEAEGAVREHITACPDCREDYEEQLRVCQAMRADGPLVFAGESSYQKLLARMQNPQMIDDGSASVRLRSANVLRPLRRAPTMVRWLAAAVIVQAFALGLAAWAWRSSHAAGTAGYMTLTSTAASYDIGPRVRVVFKADLPIGDLRQLLQGIGAQIIDGPADGDVYTLGFAQPPNSPAALEKRVAALRADRAVLLAEPVQDGVR